MEGHACMEHGGSKGKDPRLLARQGETGIVSPRPKEERMNAAWYEEQGDPAKVFKIGELPDQMPGPGEVKIKVRASGVNPTDTYTRSGIRPRGIPFERIVPHQD